MAKQTVDAARESLALQPDYPQFELRAVLVAATAGPTAKASMLTSIGETFDRHVEGHRVQMEGHLTNVKEALSEVESSYNQAAKAKVDAPKTREVKRPVLSYTWESAGLVLASLALLGLGANTIASILLSSGLPGFDVPLRAYLFSFVPVGLSFAGVGLYNLLVSEPQRALFARAAWCGGIFFGLAWVALFTKTVASTAMSATDMLAELSKQGGGAPQTSSAGFSSPSFFFCGIISECLLATACSIAARRACHLVEAAVTQPDPDYSKLENLVDELGGLVSLSKTVLSQIESRIAEIAANRKSFLNTAETWFDLATGGEIDRNGLKSHFKNGLAITVLCLTMLCSTAKAAQSTPTLVVGVSPFLSSAERNFAEAALLGLGMTSGWPSRIEVVDALALTNVATFEQPARKLSAAGWVKQNGRGVLSLQGFLRRGGTNHPSDGRVDMPGLVHFASRHYRSADGQQPTVLLFGSALYRENTQHTMFADGQVRIACDDCFASSLVENPYGTREFSPNGLAGMKIFFLNRLEDVANARSLESTATADLEQLRKFWSRWSGVQGAKFGGLEFDGKSTMAALLSGEIAPPAAEPLLYTGSPCKMLPLAAFRSNSVASTAKTIDLENKELSQRFAEATNTLAKLKMEAAEATGRAEANLDREKRERSRRDAQARFDGLLAAADALQVAESKIPIYEQAIDVAKTNSLDAVIAVRRLETVRADLAPAQLPPDASVQLIRTSLNNFPAAIGLEVLVQASNGQPIEDLKAKDFLVSLGGEKSSVRAAYVHRKGAKATKLNVVCAVDTSDSMTPVLSRVRQALTGLLAALSTRDNVSVKLLSFSSHPNWLTPKWEEDFASLPVMLNSLRGGGRTALHEAIHSAVAALADREGERLLILVTDGRNTTKSTHTPQSLTTEIVDAQVRFLAVGIPSMELDVSGLTALAKKAGGEFRKAPTPDDLAAMLSQSGKELTSSTYRLAVFPTQSEGASLKLELKVGTGEVETIRQELILDRN